MVVHCRAKKYDEYIGRPSIFGNPFSHLDKSIAEFKTETREEAIDRYRDYFYEKIKTDEHFLKKVLALRGKVLGCWCKPKSCHGDIINLFLKYYFTMKTYEGFIDSLEPNGIFVFGSNTQGRHGAGAALVAKKKFGAKYGQSEGIQGRSFAIITKDLTLPEGAPSRTPEQIKEQISNLYTYAIANPEKEFYVAYRNDNSNLNYYTSQEMADLFCAIAIPENIIFEKSFYDLLKFTA